MFICSTSECAYCRSPIASGQRWVRQKIHEPGYTDGSPHYLRYHAEPFAGEVMSCWEKHQMQPEIARAIGRAV